MNDIKSNTAVAAGLVATLSGTTAQTGNLIDLQGYGSAAFLVATGAVTDAGTASGFTVKLQESDTTAGADFTDVSGESLSVTDDAGDNKAVGILNYTGGKRYIRVHAVGTTGTNADIGVVGALQNAAQSPNGEALANVAAT